MTFENALAIVLRHEGGYVNDPRDPGGETNYGITIKTARAHGYGGSMREIPMPLVREIYRRGYWDAARCGDLPERLRLLHFDSAVNSGPAQAARWLQSASGAKADGVIGPLTMGAVESQDPALIAMRYAGARLDFLARLSAFGAFGWNWTRRVAGVLRDSAQ